MKIKKEWNSIIEATFDYLTPKDGWRFTAKSGEYFFIYKSPLINLKKGDSCIFKTSRKTLKKGHVFKNFLITKK